MVRQVLHHRESAADRAKRIAQLESYAVTSLYIQGFYSHELPVELCDRRVEDSGHVWEHAGCWEICHDGTTWEHDFDLTYARG